MSRQQSFTPVVLFEEWQQAPHGTFLGFLEQADGPELQLHVPANLTAWFEDLSCLALVVSLIAETEHAALVVLPPCLGNQVLDRCVWVRSRNLTFAYKRC